MAKYRKKPVVIEAWQNQPDMGTCPKWLTDELGKSIRGSGGMPPLFIQTLEGEMRADLGDWVIKGVKGEIYSCKSDIFEATYEPVDE